MRSPADQSAPAKRGRPPGQKNALNHRAGRPPGKPNTTGHRAGRPPALDQQQQARLTHWLAWWAKRPDQQPSAYALARRMQEGQSTVRAYAAGTRTPGPVALKNLEGLSAAYGYEPLTNDFQMLP